MLLITEKLTPNKAQRDGGFQLINTLQQFCHDKLDIMQFSDEVSSAERHFTYPHQHLNRFQRRIENATFIAEQVLQYEQSYHTIIFAHISMQFSFRKPKHWKTNLWTFPMFLSRSYQLSQESIPIQYQRYEQEVLETTDFILTPSLFEKRQLLALGVDSKKIKVVPRGVSSEFLSGKVRSLSSSLVFCSIGSIKPQKNTLKLIDVFAKIQCHYPDSKLKLIGASQNQDYYQAVLNKISAYGLNSHIELTGYYPSRDIATLTRDCHIHISTSSCETFGRSLFETLALGIPNIASRTNNAAFDYLQRCPAIKFVEQVDDYLSSVADIIANYSRLSEYAKTIGLIYDNDQLGQRLVATLQQTETLIISDFDGTLYHKNSPKHTQRAIQQFNQYPIRVICTARPLNDIYVMMQQLGINADWLIAYSGAVIADSGGQCLYINALSKGDCEIIQQSCEMATAITFSDRIIQYKVARIDRLNADLFTIETYQNNHFISHWQSNKLLASCMLLKHINWNGKVDAFGDGVYDTEYLNYFDGSLVKRRIEELVS